VNGEEYWEDQRKKYDEPTIELESAK
jgi:hypothetical protein